MTDELLVDLWEDGESPEVGTRVLVNTLGSREDPKCEEVTVTDVATILDMSPGHGELFFMETTGRKEDLLGRLRHIHRDVRKIDGTRSRPLTDDELMSELERDKRKRWVSVRFDDFLPGGRARTGQFSSFWRIRGP